MQLAERIAENNAERQWQTCGKTSILGAPAHAACSNTSDEHIQRLLLCVSPSGLGYHKT